MSRKIEIDKRTLQYLYLAMGLSTNKIGQKYGCWGTTIGKRLKEHGIKLRRPKKPLNPSKLVLREMYVSKKLSPYKISKEFKCEPGTIRRWLIKYHFSVRKKKLIKVSKRDLVNLYHKRRLSLKKIGELLGFTPSGLFGVFKRLNIKLRNYSESSRYHLHRHNFTGPKTLKAYLIGFRLGDLHVRKSGRVIRIGSGTTKKEQVKLLRDLFNNYGKVYIGNKDKKGAWHPEVSLNQSFSFLLPKHKRIPPWIGRSKNYFLNFFAGYVDAEGNIGCYPRARLKITSYDYDVLKGIGKYLKKYLQVFPVFFLEKTDRLIHNKDALSLIINERNELLKTLKLLAPLLKHGKRKNDAKIAIKNIIFRLKYYKNMTNER